MNQLASERVIVAAPMSLAGSAQRIWRLTRGQEGPALWGMGTLAVILIALAWTVVLTWYLIFGILVIPYRLIRRGQRKRKAEELRHRELLATMQGQLPSQQPQTHAPPPPPPQPILPP